MGWCREELGPSRQGRGVGGSPTHLCFLLDDGGLWLFSSRATQVTFRLGPAAVPGASWVEGPVWLGCFSRPFVRPLASRTDYNFPSSAVLRRPPPAGHCLIVCRGKLQEEINLLLTPSRELHPPVPTGNAWGPGRRGRGRLVDNATGSLERGELPGREKCKQRLH